MIPRDQYQLLDFGQGRKLERFGPVVVDRPAPAAEGALPVLAAQAWRQADARFERISAAAGRWTWKTGPPANWTISHNGITLELKPTDFGHLGVFPEQAENWGWIARRAAQQPVRLLNLFAYTGGATLSAAAAGAEVTHVDAARNIVAWARRNAELSGLADRPIRWIVEDAPTFVAREVRRGKRYDALVLDPPSYGHGPKGQPWKLAGGLGPLLQECVQLMENPPALLLLTAHTAGIGCAELEALLRRAFCGACQQGVASKTLWLTAADGRRLACGSCARWPV